MGVLFLVLLAIGSSIDSGLQNLFIVTFVVGTAAIGWNVIGGFGGQFSLGNGVFFGLTSYTIGLLMVTVNLSFVPALLIGLGVTLLAAVVIGLPSFKLTGHYFALATITVVAGGRYLVRYFDATTGGAQGFSLVPASVGGGLALNLTTMGYYYVALALFAFAVLVSIRLRYSKLGYYLLALKDDQEAASAIGINVPRYKMYGWLVTAFLTGLAGAVYTIYTQYLVPSYMFSISQSVLYAVIPIIGGIGTLLGPIVGTFVLVPVQTFAVSEFGGNFGALTYVVYGVLLILLILYAPDGIVSRTGAIGERLVTTIGRGHDDRGSEE